LDGLGGKLGLNGTFDRGRMLQGLLQDRRKGTQIRGSSAISIVLRGGREVRSREIKPEIFLTAKEAKRAKILYSDTSFSWSRSSWGERSRRAAAKMLKSHKMRTKCYWSPRNRLKQSLPVTLTS